MGTEVGVVDEVKRLIAPRPTLTTEQLRAARFERNPQVVESTQPDGSVLLVAPLETQGRGLMGMLAKRMRLPDEKTFELEPVGAFVWSLCDGNHSFENMAQQLRRRYKMNRLEAEAALAAFLQTLSQRRLIHLKPGKAK